MSIELVEPYRDGVPTLHEKVEAFGSTYSLIASVTLPNGDTGYCLTLQNSWIRYVIASASTKVFHFFYYISSNDTNQKLCSWASSSDTANPLGTIKRNSSNGLLELYIANSLVASSAMPIIIQRWYHIQVKVVIGDSGSVQVKIDDSLASGIDYTGDTKPNSYSTIERFTMDASDSNSNSPRFSGLIIDTANFLGVVHVKYLLPNADGYRTAWNKSSGGNAYSLIDEVPTSNTDYIYSSVNGDKQSVTFPDHSLPSSALIKALAVQAHMWKESTGQAKLGVRRGEGAGGTDYMGSALDLAVSSTTKTHVMELDPSTSAAWTLTNANNLEAVVETVV